jgi:hypothetical protein
MPRLLKAIAGLLIPGTPANDGRTGGPDVVKERKQHKKTHRAREPEPPHKQQPEWRPDERRPQPPPVQRGDPIATAADPHAVTMVLPTTQLDGEYAKPDPARLTPPVLGGTPRAARLPWYLPVEPAQSGVAADEVRLGDLDVRAASVVGPDHRCAEPAMARQDAYRLGRDSAGRHLIIAVADGLSSAARSDIGATIAVRAAVDLIRRELDAGLRPEQLDMVALFSTVAKHVAGGAKQLGCSPADVLTALAVAIVPSGATGPSGVRLVLLASLADVSTWVRTDPSWTRLGGADKHGLDRNSLDAFLPHHADKVDVRLLDLPPNSTLAVVTDGVGDAFTDVAGGAQWFAQRWRRPPPLASFLLDVNYEAPSQLDDRTAIVVWCGGK